MPAIAHQNKILGDDIQSIHWSQAKTSVKKNLLPITLAEVKANNTSGIWNNNVYTVSGVTFTLTTDSRGYVTQIVTGGQNTSGSDLNFIINADILFLNNYKPYIISGYPSDLTTGANYLGILNPNIAWYVSDRTTPETTINADLVSGAYICILLRSDYSGTYTWKPMLRDASISDDTYVPYILDNIELLQRMEDVQSIDLSSIVTPNPTLFEIVYAGVVLRNGIAVLSLRVKCLQNIISASGYDIVTGIPYIPLGFDNKNIECVGRNITQDNIGVMGWFSGSTPGRFDTTGGTMGGTLLAEDDIISFTAIYPYVVNS